MKALLSKHKVKTASRADIQAIVKGLNCMNDGRQLNRFLSSHKNSTAAIRSAWAELLHGTEPLVERMSRCADSLYSFKRSSVQELMGFFAPEKYPIRNATVNAGLRFFGFDVAAH